MVPRSPREPSDYALPGAPEQDWVGMGWVPWEASRSALQSSPDPGVPPPCTAGSASPALQVVQGAGGGTCGGHLRAGPVTAALREVPAQPGVPGPSTHWTQTLNLVAVPGGAAHLLVPPLMDDTCYPAAALSFPGPGTRSSALVFWG